MSVEVVAAVVASWLPAFEPPVDGNDLDTPYADRLKVTLRVDPQESLADVYRRAIDIWKPRAIEGSHGCVDDPMDVLYWAWFYEAADADGIVDRKAWEVAEQLITVGDDGRALWRRRAKEIPYGDLIRAGEHGLLRGDPLRPYVVLLLPQGPDVIDLAWSQFVLLWQAVGHILNVRELTKIARARSERLQKGVDAAAIIARYENQWTERRGGPPELLATLDRQPWEPDDLRMLLGLATVGEAITLLEGYGMQPNSAGRFELSADEESQLLHQLAVEASYGGLNILDPELTGAPWMIVGNAAPAWARLQGLCTADQPLEVAAGCGSCRASDLR